MAGIVTGVAAHSSGKRSPRRPLLLASGRDLAEDGLNLTGEAPMDIAAWLNGLGLGQYKQAFRDNEIDERVLPSLTAEDLKDLGEKLLA